MAAGKGAGPGCSIWVGNLPDNVDQDILRETFAPYGNVVSAKAFTAKWYGFVDFSTPEEAEAAVQELHGADWDGKALKVTISGNRLVGAVAPATEINSAPALDPNRGCSLWVGSLPDGMDEAAFMALFETYGLVASHKLFPEKWYGFVDFSLPEEADEAIKNLNGSACDGKTLQVRRSGEKGGDKGGGKGSASSFHKGGYGYDSWSGKGAQGKWGPVAVVVAPPVHKGVPAAYKGAAAPVGKGAVVPARAEPYGKGVGSPPPGSSPNIGARAASQQEILAGTASDFSRGGFSSNLYISGLPEYADELYLYRLFAPLGSILSTFLKYNAMGAIGFVTYNEDAEAANAIQRLHGQTTVDGYVLGVQLQRRKK